MGMMVADVMGFAGFNCTQIVLLLLLLMENILAEVSSAAAPGC